jgi:1,2-phenylacetyl-CoA epoxidase PaaB subunit
MDEEEKRAQMAAAQANVRRADAVGLWVSKVMMTS